MLFGQKSERRRLPENPEELTGSLFEAEMDPEDQARLDAKAAQDKLIHVEAHDRKVRKPIDTSKLDVKEEHLYPEPDNEEDHTEMSPEVTDSLMLVPKKMYIRRIIRHKYVLKSTLQTAYPDRPAFRMAALSYIGELYQVERDADAKDLADGKPDHERRKAMRMKTAYPEILKFQTWMEMNILKCPPSSLMEKAISYTYAILKKLSLYVTDGRYKIDDNMVENSIRPLAIGRKNYLFCGDDDAAQRAAVVYSLLATCKAHGVDERAWLEDVIRHFLEYELGRKDYSDLLTDKWIAFHATADVADSQYLVITNNNSVVA